MPPPCALLVPGAGSTPDFLERTFTSALEEHGLALRTHDHRCDGGPDGLEPLAAAVARWRPTLVGGVSHGAHLSARLVARGGTGVRGLLAVMPAWTGAAGAVAGVTSDTAARIRREGTAALLADLRRSLAPADARGWVIDELERGWSRWDAPALAAHLDAVAATPGPSPAELARIGVPTAVVALAEDPLHPAAVAEQWRALVPRAAAVTVGLADPGRDPAVLGTAAVTALLAAGWTPG